MTSTVVISPAPTANGDLHLGHLAGPFLAADVFTRHARAHGLDVLLGTGIQDTPSYVVTTAHRLGRSPGQLVAESDEQVRASLSAMGIEVDAFTATEHRFRQFEVEFLTRLRDTGALRLRPMAFPYSPRTGEFLTDGHVRGGCPVCLADGCAGLCESCGYPVAAGDLIAPRSTRSPDDPLELRETPVLVLPLEQYREQLRTHLAGATMRPHMARAVADMLAKPLPDYPVTYPTSWGIPVPFPEVAGQVINPNAEPAAWSMYCATLAAENRGAPVGPPDALWRSGTDTEVVYFLGFDNTYPFAIVGLAMLLAHGDRYRLPKHFLTNEFYELDSEKFSTSRGHVVSGHELLAEWPRDLVRFHLAATSPEYQRTDFTRAAMARVTGSRLVRPWRRIAERHDRLLHLGPLPVSARSHAAADRVVERFRATYELPGFSLNRAAETLTGQLARLADWTVGPADAGDFCHQVDVVLRCAAPILIDLTADLGPAPTDVIVPRRLPRLAEALVAS